MKTNLFSTDYLKGVDAYFRSELLALKRQIARVSHPAERKLLKVRLLLEQSKILEAEKLCESVAVFPEQILAERSYLLCTINFLRRHYEQSTLHGLRALDLYRKLGITEKLFKTCHNISINYSEMRWYDLSLHYLDQAAEYARSADDHLLILRAKACHYSQFNQFDQARACLEQINRLLPERRDFEYDAYFMIAGDISAWSGDFQAAKNYFKKIKVRQNFLGRERLACLQTFLNCFLIAGRESPLPKMPSYFNPDSEFGLQWQFLAAMQGGDLRNAVRYWGQLQALRPLVYGDRFECASEKDKRSIFFQCVEKVRPASRDLLPVSGLSGHLQKAYDVFLSSPIPLRKEELIEKIWEVPYSTEFDSRFYKLMERLKTKVAARVVQRNRAYSLEPAVS